MNATYLESLINVDSLFILASTSLVLFVISYLWKIKKVYSYFEERGIKTPKYSFFFGNYPEILATKNLSKTLGRWTKEFGKTYGYYEGHQPVIVTTDLKFIEEVFVKQFSNFAARKKILFTPNEDSKLVNLFSATKTRWKRLRSIINPTFSTAKLREVNHHLIKCSDRLVAKLDENEKTDINISVFLKRFTMDTIWNVAFGIDANIQNDINNLYFNKCENVFADTSPFSPLFTFANYFHELRGYMMYIFVKLGDILSKFNITNGFPYTWVINRIVEVVDRRLKDPLAKNKRDYLQLLLEAQVSSEDIQSLHNVSNGKIDLARIHNERKMSPDEVQMNLVLFLLAGYETTSTVLSYIFYVLAKYPDEQQKVFDEINEHFLQESNEEPNVDNVQKLTYTDMFIKEVMRHYPIANQIARYCTNPTNVCGIDIALDTVVAIDLVSASYDPDIWGQDANEFNPARFSPEIKRNPNAYMPFGIGPKNCVGMKFAYLEMKIAMVKILRKFDVQTSSKTPNELTFSETMIRGPKYGIDLVFVKRKFN